MIRASVLTGYAEVACELGLDPLRMLDAAGIPRAALTDPDMKFATVSLGKLLESSARVAEDFALRMSDRRTPSIMGPVALVVREQATLRDAIHAFAKYVRLHSESNRVTLQESGDIAIFRLTVRAGAGALRQGTELTMSQHIRILRQFLGPTWKPLSVALVHSPPKSMATHHRVFGPNVEFDQPFNDIVLNRSDLDKANLAADPEMARQVERYVADLANAAPDGDLAEQVLEQVRALLPTGRCTLEVIAGHMGLDARTLQRQLANKTTSFGDLVQAARASLLPQYLEGSDRPLVEVAELLGFSALSAFSRWHQAHFGCAPSVRREEARTAR